MIKKFIYTFLLLISVTAFQLQAQTATITFSEKKHDFGEINETDGKAYHVFEFTNSGKSTLVIQRVTASCGCTTPEWTKTPIEPGKKGNVTVAYRPLGRPGTFVKTISVYSNASNELEQLTISGNVIPKNRVQQVTNNYPISMGNLKLNTKLVDFANINKGESLTSVIDIKNNGSSDLSIKLYDQPNCITYSVTPTILRPNQEGKITITLDSKKTTEWGPIGNVGYIVLNGKKNVSDSYKINFKANVVEDFSKMSITDKRNAPIMEIKSSNLYMGKIRKGSKVRGRIDIKNVGINELEIRKVLNDNSDIVVQPTRVSIKRGRTESLRLDINSKYLPKGDYKKIFTLLTNDPLNSKVIYTVDFSVI